MNRVRLIVCLCCFFVFAAPREVWSLEKPILSKSSFKQLSGVAKQFAESHLLGTGAKQFVASIRPVDANNAIAIFGQWSENKRDDEAYTVRIARIKGAWKIVSYEYTAQRTGQRVLEEMKPPFPAPYWDKILKETG